LDKTTEIFLTVSAVIIIGVLFFCFKWLFSKKKEHPDFYHEEDFVSDEDVKNAKAVYFVRVTGMKCGVKSVGIKNPKTVREFFVFFQTDEGKQLKVEVPEDVYSEFETGQCGELTLVDGKLFGFSLR